MPSLPPYTHVDQRKSVKVNETGVKRMVENNHSLKTRNSYSRAVDNVERRRKRGRRGEERKGDERMREDVEGMVIILGGR